MSNKGKISQAKASTSNNPFISINPSNDAPPMNPKRIISRTQKNKYKQSAVRKVGSLGEDTKFLLNDLQNHP